MNLKTDSARDSNPPKILSQRFVHRSTHSNDNNNSAGHQANTHPSKQHSLNHHGLSQSSKNNKTQQSHYMKQTHSRAWDFKINKVIGKGTFGVVYQSTIVATGQTVAVKKVLQDENYKNRQLEILKQLNHPNVVKLHHSFFTKQVASPRAALKSSGDEDQRSRKQEVYLHLIMEYIPEDLNKLIKYFHKNIENKKGVFPNILIKVFGYQIFRGLAYLKDSGVCHRDIKPRNILVDPQSYAIKICDFGSAKKLIKGEPNLAYVCSRNYRAPELAFGNQNYTCKSDVWSAGCVLAEMLLGQPLFLADSSVDHLAKIFSLLGTPSQEEIVALNPSRPDLRFPTIRAKRWSKILPRSDPLLQDLLSKVLVYNPEKRLECFDILKHEYFAELKTAKINGDLVGKNLFNFTEMEKVLHREQVRDILKSGG